MDLLLPEEATDYFLALSLHQLVDKGLWVISQQASVDNRVRVTYKIPKTPELRRIIDDSRLVSPRLSLVNAEHLSRYFHRVLQQSEDGRLYELTGEPVYVHPNLLTRLNIPLTEYAPPGLLAELRSPEGDQLARKWKIEVRPEGYVENTLDCGVSCSDWFGYALHRTRFGNKYPTLLPSYAIGQGRDSNFRVLADGSRLYFVDGLSDYLV